MSDLTPEYWARFSEQVLAPLNARALEMSRRLVARVQRELLDQGVAIVPEMKRSLDSLLQLQGPVAEAPLTPTSDAAMEELLASVEKNLLAALRGDLFPEEVLFEAGDLSKVERFYFESAVMRTFTDLAAEAWASQQYRTPQTVLELGAGSGCTCQRLLQDFPEQISRFTFTDISPLLIRNAKQRFANYPQVVFQRLDIDNLAAVGEGTVDVVTSMNCLHVARDLRRVLASIHRILRPDGALMVGEVLANPEGGIQPLIQVTFGLLPSFWRADDLAFRGGWPLLPESLWREVLRDAGFHRVEVRPQLRHIPIAQFVARK